MTCSKMAFATSSEAMKEAKIIRANKKRRNKSWFAACTDSKFEAYICPACQLYHLATKCKKSGKKYRGNGTRLYNNRVKHG